MKLLSGLQILVLCFFSYGCSNTDTPLNSPVEIIEKGTFDTEFFVAIPGTYKLIIEFDRATPKDYDELIKFFGAFGCRNSYSNTPCGDYSNYSVMWSLSPDEVNADGEFSHKSKPCCGSLTSSKWGVGLVKKDFNIGKHNLSLKWVSGLEQLNHLNPRVLVRTARWDK